MPPSPAPTPRAAYDDCADADGDGYLDVADGVQALRAAVDLSSTCTPFRCDVDGTGTITVRDAIGILQRAAGLWGARAYDCPVAKAERDLSGFARLVFERQNGLGFCPPLGSVRRLLIERRGPGEYALELSVVVERDVGDPACLEWIFAPPEERRCLAEVPQPDRMLSVSEIERLRGAFADVETYEGPDPSCAIIAYDPCLLEVFRWDDLQVSDYICHGRRLPDGEAARLTTILDSLIDAPAP